VKQKKKVRLAYPQRNRLRLEERDKLRIKQTLKRKEIDSERLERKLRINLKSERSAHPRLESTNRRDQRDE